MGTGFSCCSSPRSRLAPRFPWLCLRSYTPACVLSTDTNCYYTCTSSDVLTSTAAQALLTVANQATSWLSLALQASGGHLYFMPRLFISG